MSKPAPTFRPIASPLDDISDDALDKLVDKLAIPTLVKPEKAPAGTSKPTAEASFASFGQTADADTKSPRQSPLPAEDEVAAVLERISVDLPPYLCQAMRMRVAAERTTMRYVVMQGLRAIGLTIDPRDFVPDGRSVRSKKN
jgi:hypothetical protein